MAITCGAAAVAIRILGPALDAFEEFALGCGTHGIAGRASMQAAYPAGSQMAVTLGPLRWQMGP